MLLRSLGVSFALAAAAAAQCFALSTDPVTHRMTLRWHSLEVVSSHIEFMPWRGGVAAVVLAICQGSTWDTIPVYQRWVPGCEARDVHWVATHWNDSGARRGIGDGSEGEPWDMLAPMIRSHGGYFLGGFGVNAAKRPVGFEIHNPPGVLRAPISSRHPQDWAWVQCDRQPNTIGVNPRPLWAALVLVPASGSW